MTAPTFTRRGELRDRGGISREGLRKRMAAVIRRGERHLSAKNFREARAPMVTAADAAAEAIALVVIELGNRRLVRVCCVSRPEDFAEWAKENGIPNLSHGYCESCLAREMGRVDEELGKNGKCAKDGRAG